MIVVLGAAGQVGTALTSLRPDAVAVRRDRLDLATAEPADIEALLDELGPTVLVNAAAYTAVDRAENEEATATRVNGTAVGMLAEACAARGVAFVTYSTDYVFDGNGTRPYREDDAIDPINAYGRSKRVGEELVLEHGGLVIRTSWVVSGTHPNFVATMLRLTGEGRELKVVDDQRGRPTVASDLAQATLHAVDLRLSGMLHLANHGETTWFELARTAVALAGLPPEMIQPCATSEYPTPARRPAYSTLDTTRAETVGVPPMPHWRESLPGVVAALTGAPATRD